MTAPNEGAPGPMAVGTRGQSKHQHRQSTESVVPLPDLAAVLALLRRMSGANV